VTKENVYSVLIIERVIKRKYFSMISLFCFFTCKGVKIMTHIKTENFENVIYYIKAIAFLMITFGFGYLPAVEPLTPLGMKVLGIFFGLLFGWTTIGLIWPSIVGLLGLVIIDAMNLKTVFALGWGSNTLLLIFFMMIVAAIVEQAGVSNFIAMWFITRKSVLGKPWIFTFVFLFATFILSAITSTIPAIIICWSILYSVCKQLGYKPYDSFPSFMVVGIVTAATFGLAVFPFKTVGITVFGVLENMTGLTVDYLTYICFTIPMGTLCIIAFVLLSKIFFHVDVSLLSNLTEETFKEIDLSLTKYQKTVLSFMIVLIALLLLPSVLPKEFFLTLFLNKIQASGTALILISTMCCLKIDGKPIMDFRKVASKGMQWDVLFLTSVVMPLSSILTADETGITAFLLKVLGPLFEGRSAFVFFGIAIVTAVFITQFAVNNIVGAILLPVFYPFAVELGIAPLALTSLLVYTCHFALLTPAASPMSALMHGNSEWIETKDIYKYGLLIVLSSCFVSCIVGIPYIQFLFR